MIHPWECDECGSTAPSEQRMRNIRDCCDGHCRWIYTPTTPEAPEHEEDDTEPWAHP